jgi:hypothetical protein
MTIASVLAVAACGTIEFGTELGDAVDREQDEEEQMDNEPLPRGGGNGDGMGDGSGDGMGDGNGDGNNEEPMPACDAPMPVRWPYPATAAAYRSHFWDSMPNRTACSLSACHGVAAEGAVQNSPLIPGTEAELAETALLRTAIDDLWARVIPATREGATGPVSALAWEHSPTGGKRAPEFTPQQVSFIADFIERSQNCGWAPIVAGQATAPEGCSPPNIDLSYCSR